MELSIVIVVLGIISAISISAVSRIVVKTRLDANLATVDSLNRAMHLYFTFQTVSNPFENDNNDSEYLKSLLFSEDFLFQKTSTLN